MDEIDEIELNDIQFAAVKQVHPECILKDDISFERAVQDLNDGNFTAERSLFTARFSIVFSPRSLSYSLLCRHGCRHSAMDAVNAACEKVATLQTSSTPNDVIEDSTPQQTGAHQNPEKKSPNVLENERQFYETLLATVSV